MTSKQKSPVRDDPARLAGELGDVLRMAPIPFLILDLRGRIRSLSPEAAKLLGLSEADLGRPVRELRGAPGLPDLGSLAAQISEGAIPREQEILGRDGRWYSMRAGPCLNLGAKPGGVVIVFEDIHKLKQSQTALKSESEATVRALLEAATQAILAVSGDGRIVLANAAAANMFGYARQELREAKLEWLIPERLREQHAQYHAAWRLRPENRSMGVGRDLVARRKDGSEFPVEISLSHVKANGDMLGIAFVSDITSRKKSEAALLKYQRDLQELTARLLSVQESETKLLARELHDVFSQKLAALGMQISALLNTAAEPPDNLSERLRALGKEVNGLAEDIHRMSRRLHPAILDDLGLEAALGEECDAFSRQTEIPVKFRASAVPRQLPDDATLCVYRVAQESLRNIGKHAQAKEVDVVLSYDGSAITLSIEDVGDGFDLANVRGRGGLGLISMEERARLVSGVFSIRSQPGMGTRVDLRVPLLSKGTS